MRKPLIAGNWKMHGASEQISQLILKIRQGLSEFNYEEIDILVLPPYVYLSQVAHLLEGSSIALGAQDLYLGDQGAFTGAISGPMLVDVGCQYVLIGHSERRTLFAENLYLISKKFAASLTCGLIPILCIGETKHEREQNKTHEVVEKQLMNVIDSVGINVFSQAVIAYEPVWAIGTGLTATPEEAQEVHAFIRNLLKKNNVDLAKTIRILYGGSMKPENAAELLHMPDIDGGLIGGASLKAEQFLAICAAASKNSAEVST